MLTQIATQAQTLAEAYEEKGTGGVPQLVTISTPGPYTVTIPLDAASVDVVLCGGGGGGIGLLSGTSAGVAGGETTATITGGSTLSASGGIGGTTATSTIIPEDGQVDTTSGIGGSPGSINFDGENYTGGAGGAASLHNDGGNGTAPGGGGGGGVTTIQLNGPLIEMVGHGGGAGEWVTQTVILTSGMTEITGSVGAGGAGGAAASNSALNLVGAAGGQGGDGVAYFYFYPQPQ